MNEVVRDGTRLFGNSNRYKGLCDKGEFGVMYVYILTTTDMQAQGLKRLGSEYLQ